MDRQEIINEIHQIEQEIDRVQKLFAREENSKKRKRYYETHNKLRTERLCLISQLATILPLTIEGYLGEDEVEVDRDEHGSVRQIYYFLGCPSFSGSVLNGKLKGNDFKDITTILQYNLGKYLRITIEAVEVGERAECERCNERFRCLTTKVKV